MATNILCPFNCLYSLYGLTKQIKKRIVKIKERQANINKIQRYFLVYLVPLMKVHYISNKMIMEISFVYLGIGEGQLLTDPSYPHK